MPSISSAGTSGDVAACAHFGNANAAAPATALCRNNRRPVIASFSAGEALCSHPLLANSRLLSFRRSKSDLFPKIPSSSLEFFVQSCDRVILELTVCLIRLFRCIWQPQPQHFFGFWLNFPKLHAHAHERVRVNHSRWRFEGMSLRKYSQVHERAIRKRIHGVDIATVQTQVADSRFHSRTGILFLEFRCGDKGISWLAPLLLFHDSSPLQAGAYSILNCLPCGPKLITSVVRRGV